MKKSIILIVVLLSGYIAQSNPKCGNNRHQRLLTDTVPEFLAKLKLDTFKTKPIDSFITKIPAGYIKMEIFASGNPKYAEVLSILYPNKVYIWIYVYEFTHMNPRSEIFTWDMNLFRKEKIHRIEIYNGVTCINGCMPVLEE